MGNPLHYPNLAGPEAQAALKAWADSVASDLFNFKTITGDVGTTTANSVADELAIVGDGTISTTISGDVLQISLSSNAAFDHDNTIAAPIFSLKGDGGQAGKAIFQEHSVNGSSVITLQAPEDVSSDMALRLPDTGGNGTLSEILIASQTASNSASIEFTDLPTNCHSFRIEISDITPGTDGQNYQLRTSTDNGSTFDSGASTYQYVYTYTDTAGTVAGTGAAGATGIIFSLNPGNDTGEMGSFVLEILDPANSSHCVVLFSGFQEASSGTAYHIQGSGRRLTTGVNAFQITTLSGNIAAGEFRLYGKVNS